MSENKPQDSAAMSPASDGSPCVMPCHACIYKFDLRHPTFRALGLDSARMILCEHCGNKRCPHASDHRNECTGSNDPRQAGSVY